MDGFRLEYVLPIVGAVLAGALIGFEREYRGRPAGFRTHILVSLASALLMLAAVHQVEWMRGATEEIIRIDPVRMAHGILTGIGFLCGGVIFRHGLTVHGLTTAASLWITSALGTLWGVEFYGLAIIGTISTLIVLAGLRWCDDKFPSLKVVDIAVRYKRGEAPTEPEFLESMHAHGFHAGSIVHRLRDQGQVIELATTLHGAGRSRIAALSEAICGDPRVLEYDLAPRND